MLGEFVENHSLSITTDNAYNVVETINELTTIDELSDLIHERCGTHVINLVVQCGLEFLEDGYGKVRFFCLKVHLKY
jgi:hypothetical protein